LSNPQQNEGHRHENLPMHDAGHPAATREKLASTVLIHAFDLIGLIDLIGKIGTRLQCFITKFAKERRMTAASRRAEPRPFADKSRRFLW
jgi:hypothetical protein